MKDSILGELLRSVGAPIPDNSPLFTSVGLITCIVMFMAGVFSFMKLFADGKAENDDPQGYWDYYDKHPEQYNIKCNVLYPLMILSAVILFPIGFIGILANMLKGLEYSTLETVFSILSVASLIFTVIFCAYLHKQRLREYKEMIEREKSAKNALSKT